jgi:DGQHR domain-containing protein
MGKGEDFNKRIWTLFGKAGFETKPNSQDPKEHVVYLTDEDKEERPLDLYAHDPSLGVTIISSNKSRGKLKSYTAHIHDLARLKDRASADAAIFIAAEKKMLDKERRFANRNGIQVWDDREVSYYESLTSAIESYAKYEISSSLGLVTKQERYRQTLLALRLEQPNTTSPTRTELFLFVLPADKLLPMAAVLRRARGNPYAYQRMVSKLRLPRIADFLKAPDSLLPTTLVVHLGNHVKVHKLEQQFTESGGDHFSPDLKDSSLVALEFPHEFASLEVIDGQHRLFAFAKTNDITRQKFKLAVIGIRNMSDKRRSDTFVSINDNAKRVDANLRAMLRYTDDERTCKKNPELMAIKIGIELNKKPPFEDAIKTFDVGSQVLTLKGISGYDLKSLIAEAGLLKKYYPSNSSAVYLKVLRTYFKLVRNLLPSEWDDPKVYIVATNRGFTAFLKLLRSMLRTEQKKLSVTVMRRYLGALKDNFGTWKTTERKKAYVGSQGWSQFHEDMLLAIRTEYPEFDK